MTTYGSADTFQNAYGITDRALDEFRRLREHSGISRIEIAQYLADLWGCKVSAADSRIGKAENTGVVARWLFDSSTKEIRTVGVILGDYAGALGMPPATLDAVRGRLSAISEQFHITEPLVPPYVRGAAIRPGVPSREPPHGDSA